MPRRFRNLLTEHRVKPIPQAGLAGVKNGELLRRAREIFDVLITADRNLSFQQDIRSLPLPVIVLRAKSNKFNDLAKLAPDVVQLLEKPLSSAVHYVE